jgi:hypothetical protein
MAFQQDDLCVSHQLVVGDGFPTTVLGVGPAKIRGSSFIEGPSVFGDAGTFPNVWATVMIGPNKNVDSLPPIVPGALCTGVNNPYSLAVIGDAAIFDNLDVAQNISAGNNIVAQGEVMSRCGGHILSAKKNFDIPHPTREGWRLRHTCPEAPYNDVYIRGRITNSNEINLPEYWKKLVDETSITVNLTPIGAHQDVIVKGITKNKVLLQSNGGLPIDCFYHIFAERKDGEKLIPEYSGESPADYPGNNDEYSVSGYHYDVKEK